MRLSLDVPEMNTRDLSDSTEGAERLDENLHFGRAWHRYRYCYRPTNPLRVLDVGCGTGGSSLALSKLNPGAQVRGVDGSVAAIGVATERAAARTVPRVAGDLEFSVHDLSDPFPTAWGRFDYVVCLGALGRTDEPDRLLRHMRAMLDPRGLMLVGFPSVLGRQASRVLRQAVDALTAPETGLEQRARVGLSLMSALRPDHPVRASFTASAAAHSGGQEPQAALHRFVLDALIGHQEWTLAGAVEALERAGLKLLYAATPWKWSPDRSFTPDRLPEGLRDAITSLPPERLATLIDAIDPTALGEAYQLYACHQDFIPPVPQWPDSRQHDSNAFDELIPHLTGLVCPDKTLPRASASQGRTLYRTVSSVYGELDRISVLRLGAVDGGTSCGFIDRKLASRTRASDHVGNRQDCWISLADSGFIVLQPPGGW